MITSDTEESVGWVAYADRRHGLSISHPNDWQIVRGQSGLLVTIASPEPDADSFRSRLNIVRRVQDTALDLDGLAESALSSLVRLLSEAIVIDVDTAVIANHPARRLLVAYRQGVYALTSEQWLLLDADHIWTVSAGALVERWDESADTFAEMAHSLWLTATRHDG